MTNTKFDPLKTSSPPPLISESGDKMARNSGSRDWRKTGIQQSEAQAAFEEHVANGLENDPATEDEFDRLLKLHDDESRSIGVERSSLRHGMKYEDDDLS